MIRPASRWVPAFDLAATVSDLEWHPPRPAVTVKIQLRRDRKRQLGRTSRRHEYQVRRDVRVMHFVDGSNIRFSRFTFERNCLVPQLVSPFVSMNTRCVGSSILKATSKSASS